MPVQQITVVPARETTGHGKGSPYSKDGAEVNVGPGVSESSDE